jgi:cytochrome c-type biogenesis protein
MLAAFTAGILSFVSPCVLPLLSSYLVFISGARLNEAGTLHETNDIKTNGIETRHVTGYWPFRKKISEKQLRLVLSTLCFVCGFSLVFIVMSVVVYGFIVFLGGVNRILTMIAGAIVIILGLNVFFNFIPFMKYDDSGERCTTCVPRHSILASRETSPLHPKRRKGFWGSFIVGLAFGVGWTPCVGTFLGSVLLMAGQSGELARAVVYLVIYSAGLGLPFLVAAFFWGALMEHVYRFNRALPVIKAISGLFLIATGLLIASGRLFLLTAFLQTI